MTQQNCNLDITVVDYKNIDIKCCTDDNNVWIEHKEKKSRFQHIPSNNLAASEQTRVQTPSISPTSEDSLTETGSDYDTYFAYKYGYPIPHITHTTPS